MNSKQESITSGCESVRARHRGRVIERQRVRGKEERSDESGVQVQVDRLSIDVKSIMELVTPLNFTFTSYGFRMIV